MRGTVNKDAVLNCIKRKSYVAALFPVGLIAHKEYPWLAASPDAMCMIDMEFIGETFKRALYQMCVVETKTSVSSTVVNRVGPRATPDLIVCEAGSDVFAEYIPEEHAGQILHQMVVTQVAAALYIAASVSEIMYTVLVLCPNDILRYVEQYFALQTGSFLKWTHEAVPCVPSVASEEDMEVMWSRLPFWLCINDHVLENGPFMPIPHSSQTYYSKTRGGVDGSSQWRATFRNASTNFKWEQKVVTTVLKPVTFNAFVTWRICTKEDLLHSKATFRSLNRYRRALNDVQSLADYSYDLALELLEFAAQLGEMETTDETTVTNVGPREITKLRAMAKSRKRNRIDFFNNPTMSKLRLTVKNNQHIYADSELYCTLWGQNRDAEFRGHRTVIKCLYCDVHLCLKVHPGFKKSCFDLWHSARKLRPRKQLPFSQRDEEDHASEQEEEPAPQPEDIPAWKKRRIERNGAQRANSAASP